MKWYKNFKIAAKLIAGFLLVAVIAAVVGIVGLNSISQVNNGSKRLFNENTLGIAYSGEASTNLQRLRYNALRLSAVDNEEDEQFCLTNMKDLMGSIETSLEKYKSTIIWEEDKTLFDNVMAEWEVFKGFMQKAIEYNNANQKEEVANVVLNECDESGRQLRIMFDSMLSNNLTYAEDGMEANNSTTQSSVNIMIIVIAFGVLLSIALGIYISRVISIPIKQMVTAANKIALGEVDVNIELDSMDEIGELAKAFRKMIENIRNQALSAEKVAAGDLTVEVPIRSENDLLGNNLSEMVRKNNEVLSNIFAASEQVASGSRQVSDSSIQLSEGATEQASAIEELTASIEEISSQTEKNADDANNANKLAEEVKANAIQGNAQMQEMLKAMDEINEASTNISKVIKVIDDIAFQTNILALNAAVEAARAGQHGKGFAVVAEEVRNLAARSANAARETTEMIEGTIKKSEGGTKIAKDTAEALDQIVNGIEQVASLISGIASASNEQAAGIKQINQGIMQVSQVVQANSATSEEIAATSEELSTQAEILKQTVGQYKLKVNASNSNRYEIINPNRANAIESIHTMERNSSGQVTEAKPRILLNDLEYGKY